jgi:hypothetical protein
VKNVARYQRLLPESGAAVVTLRVTAAALFVLAAITLLKGKLWTALFGLFVPPLFVAGAIRLARPGSPWARWRYRNRPVKLARADRREQRLRRPVINAKIRIQDLLAGEHLPAAIALHQARGGMRLSQPAEADQAARVRSAGTADGSLDDVT